MTRASCGNTTIDTAIVKMMEVVNAEREAGRSPLRCLALIGTRFDPGTFVVIAGCDCVGCRAEIAATGLRLAKDGDLKPWPTQPAAQVH